MARSAINAGHEVRIIAAHGPHMAETVVNGVIVDRLPTPSNRFCRMLFTARGLLRRARRYEVDILHVHDPEFLPWLPQFQARTGTAVVYDAHEDYRVRIQKDWLPWGVRGLSGFGVGIAEDWAITKLCGVISATPRIAERFQTHPNAVVIQNFPVLKDVAEIQPAQTKRNVFIHVSGVFTRARGIVEMIQALPLVGPEVRLMLVGKWSSEALRRDCRALSGWSQVEEAGYVERSQMRELLNAALAGLILYHPLPNHVAAQPNKLFEYMASGLPVVASNFPHWRKLLGGGECGWFADPTKPDEIAAVMKKAIENPELCQRKGECGRDRVLTCYNWEAESDKLLAFYADLIDPR